jgi:DNA sulfur modification protein DndB
MANDAFEYVFPAIRGVQAKREYYTSMCPLRLIPKLFLFDEEELPAEQRAQRTLNKGRIPELVRYILNNPDTYTFSALTASIDGHARFEPAEGSDSRIGLLHVPMQSRFIINDGQHRRAAIEAALRSNPELGDESVALVFFMDRGLQRCQQMFADLNRHAVRPSTSLGLLYDMRDKRAKLAKEIVFRSPFFRDVVEQERSTLSPRSRKLFTLSAIHTATNALLAGRESQGLEAGANLAIEYWEEVAAHIPEWRLVHERRLTAGEVRKDYIHSHGITLHALGRVGNALLSSGRPLRKALANLEHIDWSRSNAALWEGRALIGGRVCKGEQNVALTANLIKRYLKMPLGPEEKRTEEAFLKGEKHG